MNTPRDMASRLGDVLYWAGSATAVLAAVVTIVMAFEMTEPSGVWVVLVVGLGSSVLLWLAGRACRYVLSGK